MPVRDFAGSVDNKLRSEQQTGGVKIKNVSDVYSLKI